MAARLNLQDRLEVTLPPPSHQEHIQVRTSVGVWVCVGVCVIRSDQLASFLHFWVSHQMDRVFP